MKLSDDRTSVALHLSRTYTTEEVQSLVSELAELRSRMEPAVSLDFPTKDFVTFEPGATIQTDPHFGAAVTSDGLLRIGFRHEGFGWAIYVLSRSQTIGLRDMLLARVEVAEDHPSIFDPEVPPRDRSH